MGRAMISARLLAIASMAIVLVRPAFAQDSASPASAQTSALAGLAGTWKLDLAKSKIPKVVTIHSGTMVIKPSVSNVAFDFVNDGRPGRHRDYILDGNEHLYGDDRAIPSPFRSYYKAGVKRGVLAVHYRGRTETSAAPEVNSTEGVRSTESWEVSPDGRTLTRTFTSPEPDFNGVLNYTKQ
jgi:hypothetical protein